MRALLLVIATLASGACITKSSPLTPTGRVWRLSGTIYSLTGNSLDDPIGGARLTVQNGANQGTQASSDSAGRYMFASLDGGQFTMVIEAAGFVSVVPTVNLATDLDVNFGLRKANP